MSSARKKAKFRKNVAIVLFSFGMLNILLKVFGVLKLGTSAATSLAAVDGLKFAYYVFPLIPLFVGFLFWNSSKAKMLEAEYEDR